MTTLSYNRILAVPTQLQQILLPPDADDPDHSEVYDYENPTTGMWRLRKEKKIEIQIKRVLEGRDEKIWLEYFLDRWRRIQIYEDGWLDSEDEWEEAELGLNSDEEEE